MAAGRVGLLPVRGEAAVPIMALLCGSIIRLTKVDEIFGGAQAH